MMLSSKSSVKTESQIGCLGGENGAETAEREIVNEKENPLHLNLNLSDCTI
jgi:hypothetical protein